MAADFVAVYDIFIDLEEDDFAGLSGPRYFSLAQRIPWSPKSCLRMKIEDWNNPDSPNYRDPKTVNTSTEPISSGAAVDDHRTSDELNAFFRDSMRYM